MDSFRMWDFCGIKLESPFLSAPLAGVTDSSVRKLNRQFGAGLVFSEMISSKGLLYDNQSSKELLDFDKDEEPIGYQIFGREPEIMYEMTKKLEKYPNKLIDINMGCPVPKIVKNGEGSALLKEPNLIYDIVKAVSSATNKPVTVKIRMGWDDKEINYMKVAKAIAKGGASAITLHGRTRAQYYSGNADWNAIKELKENVDITVVGNGDIFSGRDGVLMMEKTGCDFVMIGRGMLGNPWIFEDCIKTLKGEDSRKISIFEKVEMMKRHLDLVVSAKGEERGVKEMRKHVAWYTKGMKNSSMFRNELNQLSTKKEVIAKIDEFLQYIIKVGA